MNLSIVSRARYRKVSLAPNFSQATHLHIRRGSAVSEVPLLHVNTQFTSALPPKNVSASLNTMSQTREEMKWNRFSTGMSRFHEWFKIEYNDLYELADGSFTKRGLSLPLYLNTANQFKKHLEGHHGIEEAYIFPFLARRMPAFADDEQHKTRHKAIHEGLDNLSALVKKWKEDNSAYSPTEMRECLDSFRDDLLSHLDEEVEDLKGENMKKYWKLEELDDLPF